MLFVIFTRPTSISFADHWAVEKSYRSEAVTVAAGVATTIIFCMFAYALFARPARESNVMDSLFCHTEDCEMQAHILQRWLNTSVDPCRDFDRYVCSKWVFAEGEKPFAGVMGYGLKKWADGLENKLGRATQYLKYATHVLAVFRKCMADISRAESRKGVRQLKEFMRELRVPWPEAPPAGVDPLEVVLDLSLSWRLGPWFDVTVLQYGDGTHNVVLQPATLQWEWFSIEQDILASAAHGAVWNGLYREFSLGSPLRSRSEVEQVVRTHDDIYEELRAAIRAAPTGQFQIDLRHMGAYTVNISADRQPFVLSDSVTFASKVSLKALNNIFLRHNDTALLKDLSWTFILLFSSVADRDFLTLKYGTPGMAREQRRSFCATEVDAAYRWIVVSLLVVVDFPRQSRDSIDASMNEITRTVASLFEKASWVHPDLGKALGDKVRNVSVTLWPSERLLTEEGLAMFQVGWFSKARTFTEHWISAARNWRSLTLAWKNHREVAEHPRNFLVPFLQYDHFLNAVRIALVTLSRPWYYAKGTKAMAYGSFVFFYALQLVRSFDAIGIQGESQIRGFPPARRPHSGNYGGFFPEIVAMEAAHAAYEAAVAEYERSLKVFPALSEDQLFFVAACITVCGLNNVFPVELRVSCNKAVSAMPALANAFRCPNDTAMNRAIKCAFFS
ncbi:hypothetical protein HPB52_020860 [Rhipicephalus sanguineus]|uniref:Uncharacterized protein n=1 Tax=Rhipicephalus sanguineus TaxID=34632 RepID=A0A9D4TBJ9_RHISA|nr:hypothetical protein HPB52_020860 [Rhipicephalus sanguineus]